MHAGGRFLGNAPECRCRCGSSAAGRAASDSRSRSHDDAQFLVLAVFSAEWRGRLSALYPQMDQERGVTAVVDDQIGAGAVGPGQGLLGAPPVFLQRLALPGEDGCGAGLGNGRGGMVLRGKDVAGGPAQIGAQFYQGLDEHGRLNGHVQAAGDTQSLQGLKRAVFLAHGHQTRHFGLGPVPFPCVPSRPGRDRRSCRKAYGPCRWFSLCSPLIQ